MTEGSHQYQDYEYYEILLRKALDYYERQDKRWAEAFWTEMSSQEEEWYAQSVSDVIAKRREKWPDRHDEFIEWFVKWAEAQHNLSLKS